MSLIHEGDSMYTLFLDDFEVGYTLLLDNSKAIRKIRLIEHSGEFSIPDYLIFKIVEVYPLVIDINHVI